MKYIVLGMILLCGGQLAMFRNSDNAPVPLQIATMFVGVLLFLWGARHTPLTENERVPIGTEHRSVHVKKVFLLASIGLICWTTIRALQPHAYFWEQIATWVAAIGMLCAAFRSEPDAHAAIDKSVRRREYFLLLSLLLGGLFVHTFDLGQTPALFDQDEALFANEGAQIYSNQFVVSPFAPGLQSHPYLFQGLIGLSIALFGQTFFAARLVSAVIGAVGIPAIYLLGKELFGWQTGLFAALFALGWPLHVLFARIALNQPADPLFITLAFYFLIVGLNRGQTKAFILCGVMLGIGQLFYLGGRLGPLIMVAYLVYLAVREPALIRKRRQGIVLIIIAFVFTALPQHIYLLFSHQPLTTRTWVNALATGQFNWLVNNGFDQFYRSFFALLTVPDTNWYGSSSNLLNFTGGPFFLIGVGVSLLIGWRSPRSILPIGWTFAVILLGSTFSTLPPQYQRYYPSVTAIALLVGIGGVAFARGISWTLQRMEECRDFTIASGGLLLLLNFSFLVLVFFPEHRYFANRANQVTNQLAAMMRTAADHGEQVTLFRDPLPGSNAEFVTGEASPSVFNSLGLDNTSVVQYLMGTRPYTFEIQFDGMKSLLAHATRPFALFIPFPYASSVEQFSKESQFTKCNLSALQADHTAAFYVCAAD